MDFLKKKPDEVIQKITAIILCITLFVVFGCNKQKSKTCEECTMPSMYGQAADCFVSSFLEGVTEYAKCSNVYIIKGIAMNAYEYGLDIRLVEDLKGNFPKNVSTFILWGGGNPFLCNNRPDDLRMYDNQDILIMLIIPSRNLSEMIPPEYTWLENPEDYTTIACTSSVLKLSDGYVIGHILPNGNRSISESIMSWNDFQKKICKCQ